MPQMRRAFASVAHFRPNRRNLPVLLIVVMALLGTAHILVRTWTHGAAVGFDATHYLATAEHLAAGAGLTSFDGGAYVHWPPLFPMLLALLEVIGVGAEEGGRWMNAIIFGLIVLVSGIWLLHSLRSRIVASGATCGILVAYSFTDRSSYLMTEPLFILLTLLGLIQMDAFLKSRRNVPLVLAAVCLGLGAVTRYAGVIGLLSGLLVVLLWRGNLREKGKSTLVFGLIASLPILTTLLYNQITTGTLAGNRSFASGQSLLDSVRQIISVFDQWVTLGLEWRYLELLYIPVGMFTILVCFVIFLRFYYHEKFRTSNHSFTLLGLFPVMYLILIAIIVPLSAGTPIDDRYLLPVYIPIILICAVCIDDFISTEKILPIYKWSIIIVVFGSLVHIGFSVERNTSDTLEALEQGYTGQLWNTAYWDDSETMSWLKNNPASEKIHSNAFDLVWYRNRMLDSEKRYYWTGDFLSLLTKVRDEPEPVHVVLLSSGPIPQAPYAETIRFLPGIEVVAELSDGGIYRFPAGWRFDEDGYRANVTRYLSDLTEESGTRVASDEFDVFVSGRTLVYVREPCVPADTEAWFFVHVDPDDPADLPEERRQWGFDNLDFIFDRQATWFGEKCLTTLDLPDYGIAAIRTGQYDDTGQLWGVEFALPDQDASSPTPR